MIPELIPLLVNVATLILILFERPMDVGRVAYWVGASILTYGLIMMRKP